ncbi:hypothetical protein [Catenovulum maritimum]|uniref:HEAT repeat domain-containing protein n=1 Tax=Catenovulum maritimum TaxID=1513271 RepID=A0A0J8GVZ5_9ALTE|nr:hypothetical protein [Catenovulum maritimum]KMT64843.1 hypothetical protein XM47_12430 [Catenovulum maritimum]
MKKLTLIICISSAAFIAALLYNLIPVSDSGSNQTTTTVAENISSHELTQTDMSSIDYQDLSQYQKPIQNIPNLSDDTLLLNADSVLGYLIEENLTEQQAFALSEISVEQSASLLSQDSSLLALAINKITSLPHSEQREFLLRASHNSSEEVKQQISQALFNSDRVIDRKSAVSLLMRNPMSAQVSERITSILQMEYDSSVLQHVFNHLGAINNPILIEKLLPDIEHVISFTHDIKIKSSAVKILMKHHPANADITSYIDTMLTSSQADERNQGLNLLFMQLNDHDIELSDYRKQIIELEVGKIVNDLSQSTENRQQAELTLNLIQRH